MTGAAPAPIERPKPGLRDRAITNVARALVRCFYRSVETEGSPPPAGPVILAASHLNGFVDPVVLVSRLRTFPRFLAKATLWNVAVARPALAFARVIPVHRRQDRPALQSGAADPGPTDNLGTFDSAVAALATGGMLAVFAEGTTHDDPTIRPLRTGVARIALQAAAAGVEGVQVLPVGVTYEDKVAVRGRAVVSYGTPITVPPGPGLVDSSGEPDPVQVRALTEKLQVAIQALTPHFASTEQALALNTAAQITLRSAPGATDPVPLAQVAGMARRLGTAEPGTIEGLVSLVARYQMLLGFVRLDDEDVIAKGRLATLARRVIVLGVLVVFLSPLALAGLFTNLIPVLLVLVAGLAVKAPVTKGTIRFLVAAVTFPATWVALALGDAGNGWFGQLARRVTYPANTVLGAAPGDRSGWAANAVVMIGVPFLGILALVMAERLGALIRSVVSWRTLIDRRGQLVEIRARRADVVAATAAIIEESR